MPGARGVTSGGTRGAGAAALATIATMRELDLPARARAIEAAVLPRLRALAAQVDVIGEVRGRGAMLALEIVRPGTAEPDPVLTKAIVAQALSRGVLLLACGTYGNVIRLLPPLIIDDELLADGIEVLAEVLRDRALATTRRNNDA
nr:aminotransferase class III-fold pyridoxal phosphate-dependent enzyme [Nocardia brasiliensis]